MSAARPTRLLFVLTSDVRGGVEEVVLSLLQRLDRKEFQLALAAPAGLLEAMRKELAACDVPTFAAAADSWFRWRDVQALHQAIRSFRPDIVNPHLFRSTMVAAPLAKWLRVPVVVETYHGREAWRRGPIRGSFVVDRMVSRAVDKVIAVSEAAKAFLVRVKRLPAQKIVVVPNGRDLSAFHPGCGGAEIRRELGLAADTRLLGIVGRLEPQKGHRYALEAFGRVGQEFPAARLLVVGDGSLRESLERQSRDLGIADRVLFLGFRSDVPRVLDAMDIVLLPSQYEGMPLTAIEAAALEKPIVATAVDGTREVVLDGETGRLVPPADTRQLAQALGSLLSDRSLARKLGQAARRRAQSRFDASTAAAAAATAYRSALRAASGHGAEGPERMPVVHGARARAEIETKLGPCSVVIPTKERPEPLTAVVRSILGQTVAPREIVIVDQSAGTASRDAIQRLIAERTQDDEPIVPIAHVLKPEIDGAARARNEGFRISSGKWVVFCDDDGILDPSAIEHLGQALVSDDSLVAVGGVVTTYVRPGLLRRLQRRIFRLGEFWDERQTIYWDWRKYKPGQILRCRRLNGGLMAVGRTTFEAVGGFDPRYRGPSLGEDVEISQRLLLYAGHAGAIGLVAGAWLHHKSAGEWKAPERLLELDFVASTYVFQAKTPKRFSSILAFGWLITGFAFTALGSSLRRRSPAPVAGLWRGVRCVLDDYEGCPFLEARVPPAGAE